MTAHSTINIMATAAFKEAYIELVPQFERATENTEVTTWATTAVDALTAFFKSPAAHALKRSKGMEPA